MTFQSDRTADTILSDYSQRPLYTSLATSDLTTAEALATAGTGNEIHVTDIFATQASSGCDLKLAFDAASATLDAGSDVILDMLVGTEANLTGLKSEIPSTSAYYLVAKAAAAGNVSLTICYHIGTGNY